MRHLTLLYFCKPNCAPCDVQWPKAERLAYAWKVPITKVNVAHPENGGYVDKFNLRAVPTLVLADGAYNTLLSATGDAIGDLPVEFNPVEQCCRGGAMNDDCCTA